MKLRITTNRGLQCGIRVGREQVFTTFFPVFLEAVLPQEFVERKSDKLLDHTP